MGHLGSAGSFCSRTLNPLRRREAHSLVSEQRGQEKYLL
jgi:hypothetical protein